MWSDSSDDGGGRYRSDGGRHRATWNTEDPDSLPSTVVNAVAEAKGVDGLALSEVLNDVVDPDALVRVVGSSPAEPVTVEFTLAGRPVTVDSDGTVVVEPAESE
ncbi:HalOD1 output domain-containing protein [Halorientalis halophila]|uniref:HalOD1 output domain-containing protein n=1 Tax=Halorientalis halophila TaxID=3108499 RepID=UPI00300AD8A4